MKKSTYKRPSREAAVNTLRALFPSQEMTSDEIIAAAGRTDMDAALNEAWLSGKKTALYYYNLIEPVYTIANGKRKVKSLRLTSEGVKALRRNESEADTHDNGNSGTKAPADLTLDDILAALPKLNAKLTTHRVRVVLEEVEPAK